MNPIKVYAEGAPEFARLQEAADIMTKRSPLGRTYYVGDCYFDYGQNWMWTTILCAGGEFWDSYQALNPLHQRMILMDDDISATVDAIFADKFCPDRLPAGKRQTA